MVFNGDKILIIVKKRDIILNRYRSNHTIHRLS